MFLILVRSPRLFHNLPRHPTWAGRKGYKCTSQLPAYLHRLGRAAGPVLLCGCGWEAPGGHWEHPRGRVMVVVVHHRWPGPVCFHGQGSSKVLVGERQRGAAETCAPTGRTWLRGQGSTQPPLGKGRPLGCVWRRVGRFQYRRSKNTW